MHCRQTPVYCIQWYSGKHLLRWRRQCFYSIDCLPSKRIWSKVCWCWKGCRSWSTTRVCWCFIRAEEPVSAERSLHHESRDPDPFHMLAFYIYRWWRSTSSLVTSCDDDGVQSRLWWVVWTHVKEKWFMPYFKRTNIEIKAKTFGRSVREGVHGVSFVKWWKYCSCMEWEKRQLEIKVETLENHCVRWACYRKSKLSLIDDVFKSYWGLW